MKHARNFLRLAIAVLIAGSAAFAQSVAVAPSNDPSLSPGATQQFTVTVTGFTVSGAIGWFVAGQQGGNAANGTITAGGLYKAPASVPAKNPVTVTAIATDTAGKAHLSSVSITIAPPATATQYTLTVGNGSGGGTYAAGAVVTIAANAAPAGEVFASWSGATVANATATTTTLVMPAANTTAIANYGYTLKVVNGTGSGTYSAGTVVAIKANTAPAGEQFSSWSGATVANATASTTTVTMSGDTNLTVTAQYSGPVIAQVSPNPMPTGTVAVMVTGSGFQPGATIWDGAVQLATAQPTANTLTASDWHPASTTSATITVHNPGPAISNSVVVPVSGTASYTLTVVNGSGSGSYAAGTAVSITANAASAGQTFADWTGAAVANPSAQTTTINMPASNTSVTANYAAALVVSPASATVELGATQQFSAANVTTWSAAAGSITATGLYTAPAAMTASGTDTVTAKGPGGTGTAIVTLQNYPAPAITSLNPAALPLGSFTATVSGTGFTAESTAALGGTPLIVTSQTASSLGVSGFASTTGPVNLIVSNGSAASAPLSVLVGNPSAQVSAAAARRFLEQAAFGPTPSDAANVQALGFAGWLSQQFAMGQISNYNAEAGSSQGGLASQFLANAVTNPDQLRQKVPFALSQIFVVSITTDIWNGTMIPYEQLLMADAFTNYRQILGDVTLSPAMGQYLDMANNAMGNAATGTIANQNYAREVMQLFTIGTTMLNQDGSTQFDTNNLPLPTYLQPVIADTSRVFTGWTYEPASGPLEWDDYINPAGPMMPWAQEHDAGSKQLVNGYAEPAGFSPQQDLANALDNIFNHPNVGPFVGKILIQHLVKSNPSPGYIQRVAEAFANNGSGVRGDMQAVITAILLDPEARANDNGGNDQPTDGHLQEPALFIAGMFRAFGGTMSNQNYSSWDLVNMSQDIYNPPSVFNYYAPSFVPPGSTLLGPEFQIYTPDAALWRANMAAGLFFSYSNPVLNYGPGTNIDLTPYVALAANPATLVAALDLTLTHGTMPAAMKQAIVTAVANDTNGNLSRVETGAWLILTSSYYNVWH